MQLPSQVFVHQEMRAKLGLLFNIVDLLTGCTELGEIHDLEYYSKKSVFAIQKGIDPSGRSLNMVMFDFDLLKLYPHFIKEHLQRFSKVLRDEHCLFIKSLNALVKQVTSKQFRDPEEIQKQWRSFNFDQSAVRSEARLPLRTPWGAPYNENPTPDGSLEDSHLVSLEDISTIASESNGGAGREAEVSVSEKQAKTPVGTPSISRSQRAMSRQSSIVSAGEEENDEIQGGGNADSLATDLDVISATPQSVKNTATQILSESDHHEDFLVTAPVTTFSKENMADAIRVLSSYLQPTPTEEDIENCNYEKFKIIDNGKHDYTFIDKILRQNEVDSMEFMLLVVRSIIKSDSPFKKRILTTKQKGAKTGGQFLFKNWLCYATEIMEKKMVAEKGALYKDGEKIEEMVALSILELIIKYDVIKKNAQLTLMKDKLNIDWPIIIQKVRTSF